MHMKTNVHVRGESRHVTSSVYKASGEGRVLSLDRSFDNIEINICQNLLYDNEMSMFQCEQILPQEGRRMLKDH